jgi:hypothetical protein
VPDGDPDRDGRAERVAQHREAVDPGVDGRADERVGHVVEDQRLRAARRVTGSRVVGADDRVRSGEVVEDRAVVAGDAATAAVGEQNPRT